MSGRPPLTFSTHRPRGRRWLRGVAVVALVLVLLALLWAVVLTLVWAESWWRLSGDDVPALREEVTALGQTRAPDGATTVLVALTDSVDPTVPREPELIAPLALVQVGGPRDEPAVLLLPERVEVDVIDEGERMPLSQVQVEGGADLLVRTLTDYTQVRIDHVASVSVDALPRILDVIGPVEICGRRGCDQPTPDELRSTLRTAEDQQRVAAVADAVRGLAAAMDTRWAVTSPWEVRGVVRALQEEVETDVSLRGRRSLELAAALARPTRLDVDQLPVVLNRETDEVIELAEEYQVRFQHLQDGTELAATAEDQQELRQALFEDLTVGVLNGAGIDGLAADVQVRLETAGWEVIGTGNAPSFDTSTTRVRFAEDDEVLALAAAELGEVLGDDISLEPVESQPEFEDEPVDLLVTVGEDQQQ